MADAQAGYDALMASEGVANLSGNDALAHIANLVNLSDALLSGDGARRGLEWCDQLEARTIPPQASAILDYFRANAWAVLMKERHKANPQTRWSWEQPEIAKQILLLRNALNNLQFGQLPPRQQCETLTNLGNQLNAVGRFVEALEYWTKALSIEPNFWMAWGNRGRALVEYGKYHYDRKLGVVLFVAAHGDLAKAVSLASEHMDLGYPEAAHGFAEWKEYVERGIDIEAAAKQIKLDGHGLGETGEEQSYRRWCLANRLFLDPLNDLGPHSAAACDSLRLPDFVTKLEEPPSLIGFFNQMKQEYVSARWMYYDGLKSVDGPHFSDRDVLLYNTLDYPAYGLSVEKVKVALRTAYSLFDKAAFFLNRYMNLNMPPREVSFGRIWRNDSGDFIRPEFENAENWPLRGLYWLSKDVRDKEFKASTEPDARELHEIRNHLEHKYLKVHEMLLDRSQDPDSPLAWSMDDMAYSISQSEFNAKALRVLKLARATLMYLSLGMTREEAKRREAEGEKFIAPMPLYTWDDEWKQ